MGDHKRRQARAVTLLVRHAVRGNLKAHGQCTVVFTRDGIAVYGSDADCGGV